MQYRSYAFTGLMLLALASGAAASSASSDDLNLPAGGMKGYNNIAWGWLPDDTNPSTSMATINGNTGKKASTYGRYSQITGSNYDGSQLLGVMQDVIDSGAVFQPAIMPSIPFSEVTADVASQIASVLQQFTDAGVEVWLRFGHEMNYYVTDGTYHGTASEFIQAWKNVHDAVASNAKVLMWWTPNVSPNDYADWFPGADYVDIVGMDVYPGSGGTFGSVYGDFYNSFSVLYDKHFAIGETGCDSGGSVQDKEAWVRELASADVSAFPNYVACSWFEFNKGVDFRVIQGQTADTITQTLSNFA